MDNINKEIIQKLQTMNEVYTILSRATRQPFVICDQESFNDQVWVFEKKEDLEEAVKPLIEQKNPVAAITVENKSFLNFYSVLYMLGVNSVVFFEEDRKTELELNTIIRQPDLSAVPEEKRPLFNPQLQLSGIYFMQEYRRGVELSEKKNLAELEEEVAANVVKSKYLLALQDKKDENGKLNVQVPYVKNEKGEIFQPLFTDPEEFRKFNGANKFRAMLADFANLEKVLIPSAKGVVINPQGFNLVILKDKIPAMRQRFGL